MIKEQVLQSKQMGRRENKHVNFEGRVPFDLLLVRSCDFTGIFQYILQMYKTFNVVLCWLLFDIIVNSLVENKNPHFANPFSPLILCFLFIWFKP